MRWSVVVALLLVAGPASAWNQLGGGPGHEGIADLPPVLDIVGTADLVPADYTGLAPQAFVAETPWGLLTLAHDGTDVEATPEFQDPVVDAKCALVLLPPGAPEATTVGTPFDCTNTNQATELVGPRLVAHVESASLALVCTEPAGGSGALRAFGVPSGTEAWSVTPSADAGPDAVLDEALWTCHEPAIDEEAGVAYVPFSREHVQGVVMAIDLADGTAIWQSAVITDPIVPEVGTLPSIGAGTAAPLSVTLGSHGLVVLGYFDVTTYGDAPGPSRIPFFTTMGLDGTVQDAPGVIDNLVEIAASDGDETSPGKALSRAGAANGARVAARVGGLLIIANTEGEYDYYPVPAAHELEFFDVQGSPAWDRNLIALPGDFSVSLFDVSTLEFSAVSYTGQRVGDVIIGSRGLIHALYQQPTGSLTRASLVTYHPFTHDIAQVHEFQPGSWPYRGRSLFLVHMAEVSGGLAVWDPTGHVTLLGTADPGSVPKIRADNAYPEINSPVALHLPVGPESYRVAWGDGTIERFAAGDVAQHIYRSAGDVEVRITAILSTGLTATQQLVLHPGHEPPPPLTWMQQQFTPENQERTYFVLGLIITLLGALIAVIARSRHRSRYSIWLHRLEGIQDEGRTEAFAALRALAEWRVGVRDDLDRGRLPETHHAGLDAAGTSTLERLRRRVLGTMEGRLSRKFERRLDAVLADGVVEGAEASELRSTVKHEIGLTKAERDRLADLIGSWPTA